MHTSHPDPHEHGLQDGCPACAECAEKPTSNLDESMLRALLTRTLDNRFREASAPARSEAEAVAMASVMNILERVGKLAEVSPAEVDWYLRERWHADLAAGTSAYLDAEATLRARGFDG